MGRSDKSLGTREKVSAGKAQPPEPPQPGVLLRLTLKKRGITETEAADALQTSLRTINQIICGRRGLTVDKACRLEDLLDIGAQFWLYLQVDHDVWEWKCKEPAKPKGASRSSRTSKSPDLMLLPRLNKGAQQAQA
jgi:antitoxin HigA-1